MLKDDSQHMVKVKCQNPKCKHEQVINKREVCRDNQRKMFRGDVIVVKCEKCQKPIEIEVNCAEYK